MLTGTFGGLDLSKYDLTATSTATTDVASGTIINQATAGDKSAKAPRNYTWWYVAALAIAAIIIIWLIFFNK